MFAQNLEVITIKSAVELKYLKEKNTDSNSD